MTEMASETANAPASGPVGPPLVASRRAWLAFGVLFAMHLLDFTDRNILAAVLEPILKPVEQGGLAIPVASAGWLATIYLLSHSVCAPVMGWLGDRGRRTWLLGAGVGLWSLATLGSGLAQSFGELALARSLLGVGEATYGVLAPTLLVDLFPRRMRTRILSLFYLAMPLGTALGIMLGGWIAAHHGWRAAFFVVGAPGLALALLALVLPEPVRGTAEGVDPERLREHEQVGASGADYRDLLVNSSYTYSVLGMAFYTFAIGGLVFWMPYFLSGTRGIPLEQATFALGLITVPAAVLGMLAGGLVCDRLAPRRPGMLFLVPGIAMLAAVPLVILGLLTHSTAVLYAAIFGAELLMFVNTAPCNAIIANVTAPNLRATANAIALASVHLLGDLWSPPLIDWVASFCGQADTMATPLGQMLAALGAVPTQPEGQPPENLAAGLLIVVPAILLSGIVLIAGARHLPREMALMLARLKARPNAAPAAAGTRTPA